MGRDIHAPGIGFGARLRALLRTRNLRPADFERAGVVKTDALCRWMRGEAHPDKQCFFNVCRYLRLGSVEALALLREPGEALHAKPGWAGRRLRRFEHECEAMTAALDELDELQLEGLAERLQTLHDAVRERKPPWITWTSTPEPTPEPAGS